MSPLKLQLKLLKVHLFPFSRLRYESSGEYCLKKTMVRLLTVQKWNSNVPCLYSNKICSYPQNSATLFLLMRSSVFTLVLICPMTRSFNFPTLSCPPATILFRVFHNMYAVVTMIKYARRCLCSCSGRCLPNAIVSSRIGTFLPATFLIKGSMSVHSCFAL